MTVATVITRRPIYTEGKKSERDCNQPRDCRHNAAGRLNTSRRPMSIDIIGAKAAAEPARASAAQARMKAICCNQKGNDLP